MYGYLEYQQQLLGEIYAKYVPPPTPADYFLNRLGNTSSFKRLTKQGGGADLPPAPLKKQYVMVYRQSN
jgi:hypothetical protein